MLQLETLPATLLAVLAPFQSCFTAPTFRTFVLLAAGMIAQPGRRTVVGMLIGAGLSRVWHHSKAHWFFACARWDIDAVGVTAAKMIVAMLIAADAAVVVAVDDTLFRRSGRKVAGAAWQHDGSRHGPAHSQVSYGNCFVVAGIIVNLPFTDRPVCLPVLARLWTPKQTQKTVLACQMLHLLADALPGRQIHLVADAHYAGADGAKLDAQCRERGLPEGVTLTSRLKANAQFREIFTPIPAAPKQRGGRPRSIGPKLGGPADLAATATSTGAWVTVTVDRYGGSDTIEVAEVRCLWYGVYRSRPIRVILVREPGKTLPKNGYHLALITTDLHSPATAIVQRYAARWSMETCFENAKTITGVGQARNRTPQAVARTVPFGLIVQTLTVCWYAHHGHHPDDTTNRRAQAPWYRTKTQPAYLDMIIKLRRVLIAARYLAGTPRQPTPQETLEVQQAWAEAAA